MIQSPFQRPQWDLKLLEFERNNCDSSVSCLYQGFIGLGCYESFPKITQLGPLIPGHYAEDILWLCIGTLTMVLVSLLISVRLKSLFLHRVSLFFFVQVDLIGLPLGTSYFNSIFAITLFEYLGDAFGTITFPLWLSTLESY